MGMDAQEVADDAGDTAKEEDAEYVPWARFRRRKGAIKLHTLLDLRGNIPTFIEITEGTGALDAGIQPGDVIVGFGDRVIRSMDDLIFAVRKAAVGDEKTIEFYRDQEKMELTIVVGIKPDTFELDPPGEE